MGSFLCTFGTNGLQSLGMFLWHAEVASKNNGTGYTDQSFSVKIFYSKNISRNRLFFNKIFLIPTHDLPTVVSLNSLIFTQSILHSLLFWKL